MIARTLDWQICLLIENRLRHSFPGWLCCTVCSKILNECLLEIVILDSRMSEKECQPFLCKYKTFIIEFYKLHSTVYAVTYCTSINFY